MFSVQFSTEVWMINLLISIFQLPPSQTGGSPFGNSRAQKPGPVLVPSVGIAGHLRCKDRPPTRDWGAVLRRCGNPSILSHNILISEFEVFPIPCKNGENWKTGSSDLDFKISMSCPILIANTESLLIFLSQHNYENEMITPILQKSLEIVLLFDWRNDSHRRGSLLHKEYILREYIAKCSSDGFALSSSVFQYQFNKCSPLALGCLSGTTL